jgi:hypothetical protein
MVPLFGATHDRFQRCALAGTISPKQCYDFIFLHTQRNVKQRVRVAVIGIDGIDFEQAHLVAGLPK